MTRLCVFLAATLLTACGSVSTSDAGSDGGIGFDVPPDGPCNTLAAGAHVEAALVATRMPAPMGGPIVPGDYVLTDVREYGASTGTLHSQLYYSAELVISSGMMQVLLQKFAFANNWLYRRNWAYSTSGASMALTTTCGRADQPTVLYDSDGTTLTLELTYPDALSFTFTRQ